jgi:hypothetical protein
VVLVVLGCLGWPIGSSLLGLTCFFEFLVAMTYVRRSSLWEDLRLACTYDILGRGLIRGVQRASAAYVLPLALSFCVYPGSVFLVQATDPATMLAGLTALALLGAAHFRYFATVAVQHATSGTRKGEAVFSSFFTLFISQVMIGAFLVPAVFIPSMVTVIAIAAVIVVPSIGAATARTELLHMLAIQQHESIRRTLRPGDWTFPGRVPNR